MSYFSRPPARRIMQRSTESIEPSVATDERVELLFDRIFDAATSLPAKVLWPAASFARARERFDVANAIVNEMESRDGQTGKSLEERARIAFAAGNAQLALELLTLRADRSPSASATV